MLSRKSIEVKLELKTAEVMPQMASPESAAFDLRAAQAYKIQPGETALIATGIRLALPSGTEAQIRPRSGLSWRSRLRVSNAPGTIDADFRDEIKVILYNDFQQSEIPMLLATRSPLLERYGPLAQKICLGDYLEQSSGVLPETWQLPAADLREQVIYLNDRGDIWGTEYIMPYERIAQLLVFPLLEVHFSPVADVKDFGRDRGGGFGHSGRF